MKVLMLAYLDNNLGDDLIIETIAEEFPNINFYLYSTSNFYTKSFNDLKNIELIHKNIYKEDLSKFDFCIKVGGSMFILNSIPSYIYRIKELLLAKKLKKNKIKSAVLGSNYDPFKSKFGKYLVKKELSYKNLITVRDRSSYAILQKFFPNKKNIGMFDDIVYNLNFSEESKKKGNVLGISVYNSDKIKDKTMYYSNLAKVCDEAIMKDPNTIVRLFAFDCESENDLVSCYHVQENVRLKKNIQIVPYLGDRTTFLELFSECSEILAIRFHAAVLSDILKVPFLPISYSIKMDNFLNDHNYGESPFNLDYLCSEEFDTNLFLKQGNNDKFFTNFTKANTADGHIKLLKTFFEEDREYE